MQALDRCASIRAVVSEPKLSAAEEELQAEKSTQRQIEAYLGRRCLATSRPTGSSFNLLQNWMRNAGGFRDHKVIRRLEDTLDEVAAQLGPHINALDEEQMRKLVAHFGWNLY